MTYVMTDSTEFYLVTDAYIREKSGMPLPGADRMLRLAGIRPGMRVLDLRCDVGDMTMLLARLVGPAGSVTGIDRRAGPLILAERRSETAGLFWTEFRQSAPAELTAGGPFDAAIGHDVLFRQPDPAAFLRSAVQHVRAGGMLGLHEMSPADGDGVGDIIRFARAAGLREPELCFAAPAGEARDDSGRGPWFLAVIRT